MSLVPGMAFLKPLEFPEWYECLSLFMEPHSIISECMLMRRLPGGLLDSFRMGAGHKRNQSHAKRVRIISSTYPHLWGGKSRWRWNSVTNSKWCNQLCLCHETLVKILKQVGWRGLLSWWASGCAGRVIQPEKVRELSVPNHHALPYALLPFGCSWVISFRIKL